MAKGTKTKTVGAPSPKLGVGTVKANESTKTEKSEEAQVDFSTRDFPLTLVATNDSPIQIYLNEAGVTLAPNFEAPLNTAVVTFLTADHLAREISNIEAIATAHSFDDVLQLSEVDEAKSSKAEKAAEKETPISGSETGNGDPANADGAAEQKQ